MIKENDQYVAKMHLTKDSLMIKAVDAEPQTIDFSW